MTEKISEWVTIDQDLISQFAALTGDVNRIHTDPEFCATLPQETTIAHGLLCLSLVPRLMSDTVLPEDAPKVMFNYGYDRLRFISVVPVNSRIRARWELSESEEKSSGTILRFKVIVDVEGAETPALVTDWLLFEPNQPS